MTKAKKHRFYHNWTFGGILIVTLLIILVGTVIAHLLLVGVNSTRKNNAFTNVDWDYMIDYIATEYGDGKEFIVLKKETDEITKNRKTNLCVPENNSCYEKVYIGEKANIIGYFKGEEKGYFVSFSRYVIDSPYKSGNNTIIHVYTNDNHNIEEYK